MSPTRQPPSPLRKSKTERVAPPVPVGRRDAYGAFRDPSAEGKTFVHSPTVELPVEGTVSASLPTRRAKTKYDWHAVRALIEANPGLWVLCLSGLSSGMYSYVRKGSPEAFIGLGGHLQVSLRNQRNSETAKGKVGDLWLRWIPAGWTDADQAQAEAAHAAGEGVL